MQAASEGGVDCNISVLEVTSPGPGLSLSRAHVARAFVFTYFYILNAHRSALSHGGHDSKKIYSVR